MKQSTKIIFLGLLSSIALIFSCIYFKYDMLVNEMNQAKNSQILSTEMSSKKPEIVEETKVNRVVQQLQPESRNLHRTSVIKEVQEEVAPKEKEEETVKTLKVSSLDYKIEKELITIDGEMPILENNDTLKQLLMSRCKDLKCDKKIHFSSEQVNPKWKELVTQTIGIFHNEKVENANLKVDGNSIYIFGEFKDKSSLSKLEEVLKPYLGIYNIKNEMKVIASQEESPLIENANMKIPNQAVPRTELPHKETEINSAKIVEEKISEILKEKHVNFYKNRAKITKRGKKTLDEIIAILKKQKGIQIEVHGHTDASGRAKTNQWISTQRAKSVKNYLGSRGLNPKNIVAKGFGETRLLLKNKPNSAINRRVEIKIKRR